MADNLVLRRLLWAMTTIVFIVGWIALPVVGDDEQVRAGGVATTDRSVGTGGGDTWASEAPLGGDGDGDGDGDAAPGAGAVPSVTTAGDATAADPASAASPSAASSAGPAPAPSTTVTALPPSPPELGPPVDPGPPVAPRSGLYRYRTVGGSEEGEESTTRVDERSRAGDEVRLSVTIAGGRLTSTSDVVWRPDGVRTLRSTLTFGDRTGDCDWEPDVVDAEFPLRPGATWRSDSSCAVTGLTPTPVQLQRSSTAEVLELRRVQVAGQTVDVWAIERTERLSGGGMSEELTVVGLFSPKHGLDVELRGTRSGREYRRELVNLEPEA